jgi:hypothetical protein
LKKQRRIIFLRERGGGRKGIPIKKNDEGKRERRRLLPRCRFSSLGLVEEDREEQ